MPECKPAAAPRAPRALLWISGAVALVLFVGIAWALAPLQPGVLSLQFAFSPQVFGAVVHSWPPEHLARFRAHLPADMLLLLSYGSFGRLLVTRTALFAHASTASRAVLCWLLPLAAAFDATENLLHWWLTEVPRFGVVLPYLTAASCATLKWALLLGYALAVVRALLRGEA